jgi:hypothetical protein
VMAGSGNLERTHGSPRIAIEGCGLDLGLRHAATVARCGGRLIPALLRRLC